MPRRETRRSIERALAEQQRNWRATQSDVDAFIAKMERHLAEMRKNLDPGEFTKMRNKFERAAKKITVEAKRKRRRPGDGGLPALVEPPRGPKPLAGGAAAPLEFD